ncbi:helix-turn-helix domain-containing protein [Bacillus sp. 1NLA3E]|uniref:helix-turn-helix domain-containing protein n=1 Tax=Bacillus sp. 1NLA3E TaxID=666686 RepID=UPI000247F43E|nr:helix-turn-helix domain-containing protein [Bacillus sp. 1NLA3E]AGK55408.1 transcriptional regulator SinR [Bacillus sp. 1NLA3E]
MIGQRIKYFRELKGYSLSKLAKLAHVSKSYLSHIERDVKSNPSLHFLIKIADSLEISIDNIILTPNSVNQTDLTLDEEWEELISLAINEGASKEEFSNHLKHLKFEKWKNEQK